ncbi:hypothetical protein LCGC14_0844030 [marine sediment metagenome]|uniref:Uncharacterized protein n=1 Tax=marine sediment metagenome TaxID=412755 RepID=A0A0F9SJC1_9ZZZZ
MVDICEVDGCEEESRCIACNKCQKHLDEDIHGENTY